LTIRFSFSLFWRNRLRTKIINETKFLGTIYIFAVLLMIGLSLLFPVLSQHFFFYKFIPKISFFLPRTILPETVIIFFILSWFLSHLKMTTPFKLFQSEIIIFIFFLGTFWIKVHNNLNISHFYLSSEGIQEIEQLQIATRDEQTFFYPPWIHIEHIDLKRLELIPNILQKEREAQMLEQDLYSNFHSNQNTCKNLSGKTIYFTSNSLIPQQLQKYSEETLKVLSTCCQFEKELTLFQKIKC
jgi:hypothetical protein